MTPKSESDSSSKVQFRCPLDIHTKLIDRAREKNITVTAEVLYCIEQVYLGDYVKQMTDYIQSQVTDEITQQTKILTDLINDKIIPIGVVLPDLSVNGIIALDTDDDFIDWHEDIYETAIRLINRYILLLNQHNYTMSVSDMEHISTLIGNATVKPATLL